MDCLFEPSEIVVSVGGTQFTGDPDLILIRDDLADEIGAVVGYLECARQIKEHWIRELFWGIAAEESGHYVLLMRMLACLDPVQAEELKKQGLGLFIGVGETGFQYAMPGRCKGCENTEKGYREYSDRKTYPPDERVLECLQHAIRDEFHAINAYQGQIIATTNLIVKNLLTTIMNKEKEHVSEFTQAFYELTR